MFIIVANILFLILRFRGFSRVPIVITRREWRQLRWAESVEIGEYECKFQRGVLHFFVTPLQWQITWSKLREQTGGDTRVVGTCFLVIHLVGLEFFPLSFLVEHVSVAARTHTADHIEELLDQLDSILFNGLRRLDRIPQLHRRINNIRVWFAVDFQVESVELGSVVHGDDDTIHMPNAIR